MLLRGLAFMSALLLFACNELSSVESNKTITPISETQSNDESQKTNDQGADTQKIEPARINCPEDICYRVTFTEFWDQTNFPTAYPANTHFSPLTGASHGPVVAFYQLNQLASDGIEQMAETGGTSKLVGEINQAIASGSAFEVITTGGISNRNQSVSAEFKVSSAYPLVTLVSMIAPSPDWFVGVESLDMRDIKGNFYDQLSVDLIVLDAGTDRGRTFTSANADETNVIQPLNCADLINDCGFSEGLGTDGTQFIGQFEFERIY